jgi:hypothetical protein
MREIFVIFRFERVSNSLFHGRGEFGYSVMPFPFLFLLFPG